MSFWDENDTYGFNNCNMQNIGQVNMESELGKYIYNIASDNNYNSYLEIGTWNGLGSTKCFIDGFKNRSTPFIFYTLECNTEKWEYSKELYKHIDNVHILNEVILNNKPDDILQIFPELVENKDFIFWNNIDFNNMKDKPLFLHRNNLPEIFDIILFDGGEFTNWYEYQQLKDRCNIILLDDVNVPKCRNIFTDLINQADKWELVFKHNERNGTACFKRFYPK